MKKEVFGSGPRFGQTKRGAPAFETPPFIFNVDQQLFNKFFGYNVIAAIA